MRTTSRFGWAGLLATLACACGGGNEASFGDDSANAGTMSQGSTGGDSTGTVTTTGSRAGTGGQSATGGTGGNGGVTSGGGGSSVSAGGAAGSGGRIGSGGAAGASVASDGGVAPTMVTCKAGDMVVMPTGAPPALQEGQWVNISPPGLFRPRASAPPFGCMDIQVNPCNPYELFLTTDIEGMWKSTDGGATWKQISNLPSPISPGVIAIDPAAPANMYYIGGVRGASPGFWVSKDGGNTWTMPQGFSAKADNSADGWSNDLYDVKADPADFNHVLVTFHAPWNWTHPAGVLESKDGGTSWTRRMPGSNWGQGHSIWFLNNGTTWLLGAQYGGYWRTTDSGVTWTQSSTVDMQHGGTSAFVSSKGVLYVGALSNILRSTDNGVSFTPVAPHTGDGYYAIVGDGNNLYSQQGNTGGNGTGMDQSYITSPESDGVSWTTFNSQKFADGPYRMAFDSKNRIIYSSNWNAGVWAMKVK
jgi:photosystem II stability/assembly factor-like uncharacterized protein